MGREGEFCTMKTQSNPLVLDIDRGKWTTERLMSMNAVYGRLLTATGGSSVELARSCQPFQEVQHLGQYMNIC